MRERRKIVKPLKRRTHFGDEVWSWAPGITGVRIRSPKGETTFVPREEFMFELQYDHGMPGQEGYTYWCCEECCPTWGGPGFTPSLIKTYIRMVLKNGGIWIKPWDLKTDETE